MSNERKPGLSIEWWPIDQPKPYAKNPRKISPRAIETVARSLAEFGWRQPIVVDKDGVIVAGHTRLLAAKSLGYLTVPVHVALELTAAQARAYRIMDNRSADETEWDEKTLAEELAELQALEIDLGTTGFEPEEITEMLTATPTGDAEAAPDSPAKPTSRTGDLWALGNHRVLCGDSASDGAVQRVCGGAMAKLLWTDPPYGVDYIGKTKDALTINGDGAAGLPSLLRSALGNCGKVLAGNSHFYIASPSGPNLIQFFEAVIDLKWRLHQCLVWVKDTMVLGHSDYHWKHESILYGYLPGEGRPGRGAKKGSRWFGGDAQKSVFTVPKPTRSEAHPTMKPVELVQQCITNSSRAGELVLDPFSGSGSTLIACEQSGRVCAGVEIDPIYVDVIVTRWEEFTGKLATLEGDGRTFAEIKTARASVDDDFEHDEDDYVPTIPSPEMQTEKTKETHS